MKFKNVMLFIAVLITTVPLLAKEQTDSLQDTVWTICNRGRSFDYVKILPDGQHFIAHTESGTQIRMVNDGKTIKEYKGDSLIQSPLDLSKNKKMFAGCYGQIPVIGDQRAKGRNIMVVDYETNNFIKMLNADKYFKRYATWLSSISFSGDGEHLAATFISRDSLYETIKDTSILIIWNTKDWSEEKSFILNGKGDYWAAYSPTNDYIFLCHKNAVYPDSYNTKQAYISLINTNTWEETLIKQPVVKNLLAWTNIGFSPDGKKVALGTVYTENKTDKERVVIWDIPNIESYKVINDDQNNMWAYFPITFSKDSKYLITSNGVLNTKMDIWDLDLMKTVYTYNLTNYFRDCGSQVGETPSTIACSPDNRYILTGGYGLILFNTKGIITGIKDDVTQSEISIYPNPSDGQVNISFPSEKPEFAKVLIINNEGKEISTIYNGIINPGENNFTWDSNTVSPGVYYCKIEGININRTFKIIINK